MEDGVKDHIKHGIKDRIKHSIKGIIKDTLQESPLGFEGRIYSRQHPLTGEHNPRDRDRTKHRQGGHGQCLNCATPRPTRARLGGATVRQRIGH